ncbi:MAG: hypothetical protein HOC74_02200 [Gemmatimonadetes bacterium]|jgi:hypothetical protein|nr:hypothetical protein [Gemmatimonadota bacterium]
MIGKIMKIHASRRRVALCLLLSAGLHLLVFILARLLFPTGVEKALFRVRVPSYLPRQSERFRSRPSVTVSRELLGRLRATRMPRELDLALGEEGVGELPDMEIPFLEGEEVLAARWEKGEWVAEPDSFPDASLGLLEQTGELPLALDMLDLDAQRRKRTVVIVDPETGKLERAYLHLPVYMNADRCSGCPPNPGGSEVAEILNLIRRGFRLPGAVPIFSQIHWFKLGGCISGRTALMKIERFSDPDPIHRYYCHPQKHILHHTEMTEYPVILLDYIDVESSDTMAQYLIEGGFVVADPGRLGLLEQKIRKQVGERLERIRIELGHPLFHSFYDIDHYFPGGPCPGTGPLPGLELDGRLIAVASPRFTRDKPCPANRLYVNVIAYALVQPSPMGGRYLARSSQ